MPIWKLTLAYDGTPYHGWQVQPGLETIQGMLADAIHRVTGERVLPQGSGRTDAGVHALGQVTSFELGASIPAANFQRALNRCLPPSIRVLSAEHAPAGFHARHSALRKAYEYRIFPLRVSEAADRICPPTLAPYVWPCSWPLDLEALNHAARYIAGTHDFTTFAASDPDRTGRSGAEALPPPIRTIHHSCWHLEDDLLIYRVTGSGFLHHMVRNLVGTFVQAGALRLDPETLPELIAGRSRALCGPTAPATGLFLVSVTYPEALVTTDNSELRTGL